MSSILIVEDEQHLAQGLQMNLELEGYKVDVLDNGEDALERIGQGAPKYDLLVLDVMLPGKDGFDIVKELRDTNRFIPTLLLTARNRPEDIVQGFAAGADDYLPKPFELSILIARINGLLRRRQWLQHVPQPSNPDVYSFNGKTIDFAALELRVGDKHFPLTLMEANLLRYLIRHEGQAVSRKAILEDVWGVQEDTDTRPIDNFIVRLRRYLEDDPAIPKHLLTVRGVGYRFVSKGS